MVKFFLLVDWLKKIWNKNRQPRALAINCQDFCKPLLCKSTRTFVSTFCTIDLALLWLTTRSALVEVPELNIPLVVAHIQSATVLCGDWSIPLAIWPWRCLLSWLLKTHETVLRHLRSILGICKFTDCLGSLVQCPQLAFLHFPAPLGLAYF